MPTRSGVDSDKGTNLTHHHESRVKAADACLESGLPDQNIAKIRPKVFEIGQKK
ncbi:hypothetical protein AVEN_242957-1, partial [Araneus ventricosus]